MTNRILETPLFQKWVERNFQDDFYVRVRMTHLQRHLYHSLLQQTFICETQPYAPDDDDVLAALADAESIEQWKENRDAVLAKWEAFTDEQGRKLFRQKRLEQDWLSVVKQRVSLYDKRSSAGRIGGLASGETRRNAKQNGSKTNQTKPETETETETEKSNTKPQHANACPESSSPPFPSEKKAAGKSRRGTRIPESFTVTEEHRAFARRHNLPSPDACIAEFKDYWKAQAGSRGVKLDWDATFRNWLRHAAQYGNRPGRKKMVGMVEPATAAELQAMKETQLERNENGTYRIK